MSGNACWNLLSRYSGKFIDIAARVSADRQKWMSQNRHLLAMQPISPFGRKSALMQTEPGEY